MALRDLLLSTGLAGHETEILIVLGVGMLLGVVCKYYVVCACILIALFLRQLLGQGMKLVILLLFTSQSMGCYITY